MRKARSEKNKTYGVSKKPLMKFKSKHSHTLTLSHSHTLTLALLPLRQTVSFFPIHHIQEFKGTDFKIPT
jgi:hypothetical protein